ncbi:hypothetical protein MKZ38_002285 [Zalerion maritima]|uniref:Uncharacterized protein n=1 Tax=Zalerion maritima TaxID=339359 RepID=A0AAD5RQ22_9PEZI|nr:hypothetical protein MKZ38_002285 [Zalerion maritima]
MASVTPSKPLPPTPSSPPPPRPRDACPWFWRCHNCGTWYRLGTTRRCLECSHIFCTSTQEPATASTSKKGRKISTRRKTTTSSSSSSSSSSSGRPAASCRAEFDYAGWKQLGEWRREAGASDRDHDHDDIVSEPGESASSGTAVGAGAATMTAATIRGVREKVARALQAGAGRRKAPGAGAAAAAGRKCGRRDRQRERAREKEAGTGVDGRRDEMFWRRRHDCWWDCDYPSECRHTLYEGVVGGKVSERALYVRKKEARGGGDDARFDPMTGYPVERMEDEATTTRTKGVGMESAFEVENESCSDEARDGKGKDDRVVARDGSAVSPLPGDPDVEFDDDPDPACYGSSARKAQVHRSRYRHRHDTRPSPLKLSASTLEHCDLWAAAVPASPASDVGVEGVYNRVRNDRGRGQDYDVDADFGTGIARNIHRDARSRMKVAKLTGLDSLESLVGFGRAAGRASGEGRNWNAGRNTDAGRSLAHTNAGPIASSTSPFGHVPAEDTGHAIASGSTAKEKKKRGRVKLAVKPSTGSASVQQRSFFLEDGPVSPTSHPWEAGKASGALFSGELGNRERAGGRGVGYGARQRDSGMSMGEQEYAESVALDLQALLAEDYAMAPIELQEVGEAQIQ